MSASRKRSIDRPMFESLTAMFCQDGNTVGTTDEYERLEISLVTQLPGMRPFFVLKSETGWSFDSVADLKKLIDQCLLAVGDNLEDEEGKA